MTYKDALQITDQALREGRMLDDQFSYTYQETVRTALRIAMQQEPSVAIYDTVETHPHCTVQILSSSVSGDVSVGWTDNDNPPPTV